MPGTNPPTPPGVERVRFRSKLPSSDQQATRPDQAAAGHCPMQAPACRQASQNRASAGACRLQAPAGRQATRKSSIFLSKGRQERSYAWQTGGRPAAAGASRLQAPAGRQASQNRDQLSSKSTFDVIRRPPGHLYVENKKKECNP